MSEDKITDIKREKKGFDFWWDNGLKFSFVLSGWLVGPLVLSLYIGQWLDEKYQTKPWLFLFSVGLAFCLTCFGLVLEAIKFIKAIEKESLEKKEKDNHDRTTN
ncbi:MAG: AtpZ/AtpI family protein [Candidatus Buchananbacteria bacterium]